MKEQCDYSPHIGIDNGIKYLHYKYFIIIARKYIYQPSNYWLLNYFDNVRSDYILIFEE